MNTGFQATLKLHYSQTERTERGREMSVLGYSEITLLSNKEKLPDVTEREFQATLKLHYSQTNPDCFSRFIKVLGYSEITLLSNADTLQNLRRLGFRLL